jgi:Transposase DDE domain
VQNIRLRPTEQPFLSRLTRRFNLNRLRCIFAVIGYLSKSICYDTLNKHGAKAAIPLRKGAKIWRRANTKAERHVRDKNLRRIRKVGRKEWKRESNYHRRSSEETQAFRFKTTFGDRLQTRQIDNQFNELMLKSAILNRMTHLGIADSVKVVG